MGQALGYAEEKLSWIMLEGKKEGERETGEDGEGDRNRKQVKTAV